MDPINPVHKNHITDAEVKRCHFLAGKHFIVFADSIVEKIGITDEEFYFHQELSDDGCIILRPYRQQMLKNE